MCVLYLCIFCQGAYATDQSDIATGLKVWLLVNDRPSGTITVAVIFDASNPNSKADAKTIKEDIDKGIGVPEGLNIVATLVSIADIAQLAKPNIAFVANGVSQDGFDTISKAATVSGILTISADTNCVQANKCVIGVTTQPRVEIYYSPVAAEASRIKFAPAFIMLARQI